MASWTVFQNFGSCLKTKKFTRYISLCEQARKKTKSCLKLLNILSAYYYLSTLLQNETERKKTKTSSGVV